MLRSDLEGTLSPDEVDCVIDSLPDYSDEEYEAIVRSYETRDGAPQIAADVGTATVDCVS